MQGHVERGINAFLPRAGAPAAEHSSTQAAEHSSAQAAPPHSAWQTRLQAASANINKVRTHVHVRTRSARPPRRQLLPPLRAQLTGYTVVEQLKAVVVSADEALQQQRATLAQKKQVGELGSHAHAACSCMRARMRVGDVHALVH